MPLLSTTPRRARAGLPAVLLFAACFTPVEELATAAPPKLGCAGSGRFTLASARDAGTALTAVAGDFDEDGHLDAVVAMVDPPGGTWLELLAGRGDGTFEAPVVVERGRDFIQALATGDLDADGHLDLVEAVDLPVNPGPEVPGAVRVFHGDGTGRFRLVQVRPVGFGPFLVRLTQLDGDGLPDLALAHFGSCFHFAATPSTLEVLWGQRDGTFLDGPVISDGSQWNSVSAGDLDGDGLDELAATSTRYEGNCGPNVTTPPTASLSTFQVRDRRLVRTHHTASSEALTHAVVMPPRRNGDSSVVLIDWGTEVFRHDARELSSVQRQDWHPQRIYLRPVTGDFDADGVLDIAAPQLFDPLVTVLLQRADGTLADPLDSETTSSVVPRLVLPGDFDADGALDLIAFDHDLGQTMQVLHNVCR